MHTAASALASLSLVSATSISPSTPPSHMHTRSQSQAKTGDTQATPVPISGRRAVSGALAKSVPIRDFDSGSLLGDEIEVDVEDDENDDEALQRAMLLSFSAPGDGSSPASTPPCPGPRGVAKRKRQTEVAKSD